MLGTMPDGRLAKIVGCTRQAVQLRRILLDAPACPCPNSERGDREVRTLNAVDRAIGEKRICEMSGKEYVKAVARVMAELQAGKAGKRKRN
jgi:hypothetical protein